MVFGIYWFYEFPEGLYKYEFFQFRKGLGGMADAPAELRANVMVNDGDFVIGQLRELVNEQEDALIFVKQKGDHLLIEIGGYQLFDFEFELALKVEEFLKRNNAQLSTETRIDASFLRLEGSLATTNNHSYGRHQFLQTVFTAPTGKFHSEYSALRLDCHLPIHRKEEWLDEIQTIAHSANLNAIQYLEQNCGKQVNLILFFTNGRQGMNLVPKQKVDSIAFENGLSEVIENYDVKIGHIEGYDNYPKGEHKNLIIVDEDFFMK